jgi:putative PIN family toxin of toxin-antitoxin system
MKKVVLDTNVLISALIQRSYPNLILYDFVIERQVELCISDDLIEEYLDMLNRPKFSKYPDFGIKAEFVLSQILEISKKFEPKEQIDIISDKDDNKILELAVESNADFIITGNTNDFTMNCFRNTKIVSPKEFWEIFNNKELIK